MRPEVINKYNYKIFGSVHTVIQEAQDIQRYKNGIFKHKVFYLSNPPVYACHNYNNL